MPSTYLTPPAIAERLGVSPEKVVGWITSGRLVAVNVSDGTRPRWRVPEESLANFLSGRQSRPPVKPIKRRRQSEHVIEFF